jgi:hypothetical protein
LDRIDRDGASNDGPFPARFEPAQLNNHYKPRSRITMMKRIATVLVMSSLLALAACATNDGIRRISYDTLLTENQVNILKVSPGLTKQQVLDTMGTSRAKVKSDLYVTNPYKNDFFTIDKDNYEVIYYLTQRYHAFSKIKESQATPVVIKNGQVVGLGFDALSRARGGKY